MLLIIWDENIFLNSSIGRPFVVGLMDPKIVDFTAEMLKEFQTEINSSTDLIAVRDLQVTDK